MKARLSAAAAVVAAALAWWAAPTPARAAEPNWPDTLILATASPAAPTTFTARVWPGC